MCTTTPPTSTRIHSDCSLPSIPRISSPASLTFFATESDNALCAPGTTGYDNHVVGYFCQFLDINRTNRLALEIFSASTTSCAIFLLFNSLPAHSFCLVTALKTYSVERIFLDIIILWVEQSADTAIFPEQAPHLGGRKLHIKQPGQMHLANALLK